MVYTQLSGSATDRHTIHTNSVGSDILKYLQPSNKDSLGLEVPTVLPREMQGLHSHITAQFLIPRQHLDAFEESPDRYTTLLSDTHHSHVHSQDHCQASGGR